MADSPRIEELKRRVQSDPASIAFAALAEEYRRAGRFDEAIDTCTTGLVRHPSYLSAHVTLGRALIEVGRLEDAREELEHVLRLAPENLAAIRGLAEIHDRLGAEDHAHSAGGVTRAIVRSRDDRRGSAGGVRIQTARSRPFGECLRIAQPGRGGGRRAADRGDGRASLERVGAEFTGTGPAHSVAVPFGSGAIPAERASIVAQEVDRNDPPAETAALAGLEEFLAAIQRARTERAASR